MMDFSRPFPDGPKECQNEDVARPLAFVFLPPVFGLFGPVVTLGSGLLR